MTNAVPLQDLGAIKKAAPPTQEREDGANNPKRHSLAG